MGSNWIFFRFFLVIKNNHDLSGEYITCIYCGLSMKINMCNLRRTMCENRGKICFALVFARGIILCLGSPLYICGHNPYLLTSRRIIFFKLMDFIALKCALRANSDFGSITPLSVVTEKSSPRFSRPLSLHDTGSRVLFLRKMVLVSFLQVTEMEENK